MPEEGLIFVVLASADKARLTRFITSKNGSQRPSLALDTTTSMKLPWVAEENRPF
jgi:hypothetical protein